MDAAIAAMSYRQIGACAVGAARCPIPALWLEA